MSPENASPTTDPRPGLAAIEVEEITKRFGEFTAVDRVTFKVEHGEIFGLLGPNGAGKSTLIRMLTTLLVPTSGTARINAFDVRRFPSEVRQSIGVIPQAMTSDLDLSAEENILIFAKLYGVPRERRKRTVREALEIARGLVHQPRILFLDEPTTGLDPVSRVAVWEMLSCLKKQRDLTILLA